jgi:hypothetical protein
MSDLFESSAVLCDPDPAMVAFVERQVRAIRRSRTEDDARDEDRFLMVFPVIVQPLSTDYEAIDEPFVVVSRDISQQGIGLVHSQRIDQRLLALNMTLAGEIVNVAVKVRWCQELGPFYYIGARFVAKLPLHRP